MLKVVKFAPEEVHNIYSPWLAPAASLFDEDDEEESSNDSKDDLSLPDVVHVILPTTTYAFRPAHLSRASSFADEWGSSSTPSPAPLIPLPSNRFLSHALAFPSPLLTGLDLSRPPLTHPGLDPALLPLPAAPEHPDTLVFFIHGFPWQISITPPTDAAAHTSSVGDVLEHLYACLQRPVKETELARARANSPDKVHSALAAWAARDPGRKQRMKRIDFLLRKHTFLGIELLDSQQNRWKMHVGN